MAGAYAAYNAGPARYIRHAANGIALPAETVAYVAGLDGDVTPPVAARKRVRWQEAALFPGRGSPPGIASDGRTSQPAIGQAVADVVPAPHALAPSANTMARLFPLSMDAALATSR